MSIEFDGDNKWLTKKAKPKEDELHEQFKHLHHRGEWHCDAPELREYIREHATPY